MKTKKNNNKNTDINFEKAYIDLIKQLKNVVNSINASDYSKKSLGRFKEKVEKIVYDADNFHKD